MAIVLPLVVAMTHRDEAFFFPLFRCSGISARVLKGFLVVLRRYTDYALYRRILKVVDTATVVLKSRDDVAAGVRTDFAVLFDR